jgi:hypothetical protein
MDTGVKPTWREEAAKLPAIFDSAMKGREKD